MADDADDLVRDLAGWMRLEDDLRGRVNLVDGPPVPGTLGTVVDTLVATVTPAVATAVTTSLVTWLRHRRGKIRVIITGAGGKKIDVTTEGVEGLTTEQVKALVHDVTDRLQ